MSELKNLLKGTVGFIILGILILLGLRFLASEMGAGSAGYNLSSPFLVMQAATIILCYIAWYRKVNREASNMMDIAKMRAMAFASSWRYLVISVLITAAISAAAFVVMFFDLFRIGIPAIYIYSSVFTVLVIGNATLFLLMRFVLPNRVTGSY